MSDKKTINTSITLPHLGIMVTSYCNLNCRHCADLIPHRRRWIYPIDEVMSDFKRFLEAVDCIKEILIIGGETLIYPTEDLCKIIEFCGSHPKIENIILITNGKTVPDETLVNTMKAYNVIARVSGYPEYITPNRPLVINSYTEAGLIIDNLENMSWCEIGDNSEKNKTAEEMTKVFSTCSMRACVTMVRGGYVVYCSRQSAALENISYPKPDKSEYVDIRNSENLAIDIANFINLPYISTCKYCNGISCNTTTLLPSAIQILPKEVFLSLVESYYIWKDNKTDENIFSIVKLLMTYKDMLSDVFEFPEFIKHYRNTNDPSGLETQYYLARLLNKLLDDYTFKNADNIPHRIENPSSFEPISNSGKDIDPPNVITAEMYTGAESNADILVTEEDLIDAANETYPFNHISYTKLFLEARFEKIISNEIACAVCGLSYTQHGILEKNMPLPTANLSVAGQDIPYSLMMAKRAISLSKSIKYIIIPMSYYQGFYDVSSDEHIMHERVVGCIDAPLFDNPRNYKKEIYPDSYCDTGLVFNLYSRISDLRPIRDLRDAQIKEECKDKDFFSDICPMNEYGGLKFDFHALKGVEKSESAAITEKLNHRIVTDIGFKEVKDALNDYKQFIKDKDVETIFFVPPFTEELYKANINSGLKDKFYSEALPLLDNQDKITFIDLCNCEQFDDEDFCDFEHLRYSGAQKLTNILGKYITE